MCAKKAAPAPAPASGFFSTLASLFGGGRWVLVGTLLTTVLGVGWYLAWNHVRDHVLTDGDYHLDPKSIAITPQPAWIITDVKAEVARDASFDSSLSILDDDLTVRMANAFALHPWIAKVVRVSKHHPARVEVEVVYRKPIAMVEVRFADDLGERDGLLPVDAHGTLLPSEDFSPAAAKKFPRIARADSLPAGPVGTNWGDVQVTGAAMIAEVIGDRWDAFKLFRVLVPQRSDLNDADGYTFELLTHAGTRILWGRPPGSEPNGEPVAAEKLAVLEQIAKENGTLKGAAGSQTIDLRRRDPRTAIKKLPAGESR